MSAYLGNESRYTPSPDPLTQKYMDYIGGNNGSHYLVNRAYGAACKPYEIKDRLQRLIPSIRCDVFEVADSITQLYATRKDRPFCIRRYIVIVPKGTAKKNRVAWAQFKEWVTAEIPE